MPLLCFNTSTAGRRLPVVGKLVPPNSLATEVTNELTGLSGAQYTAIAADTNFRFQWSLGFAEFATAGLLITGLGVISTPQALSGAGALNLTTRTTLFTSTGAAQALTLANGSQTGQRKTLFHTVDGGSGVLTPATAGNFATVTIANLYDWAEFEWSGAAWNVVGFGGTGTVIA